MTDEYIQREAAMIAVGKSYVQENDTETQYKECVYQINRIPAADVRPVVHGCWIKLRISKLGDSTAECEKCGATVHSNLTQKINFCPNCGADMREVET